MKMDKNKAYVENVDESFPAHLEVEILKWLPLEDVCKFRSVCREWNALFSSAKFITRKWIQAPPNSKPCLLIASGIDPCLRYCFFTRTWKSCMSLSFTKDQQKEKVADNSLRKKSSLRDAPVLKGTGTGLFLFQVPGTFRTHIVCNPLTQAHFKLPPTSSISRPVLVSGIVGGASSGEAYNVVAVGQSRFGQHIVEIYDSSMKSWRVAATLPTGFVFLSEGSSHLRESLVFCNGFVYFGVFRPLARPNFGMIGFSMQEGTRMAVPIFAHTPTLNCRSKGILLACGSRLLLVGIGGRETNSPKEEIVIWEFEKMEPENGFGSFKEIASVTPPFQRSYKRFDCVGVGDRVCFIVHRAKQMEVVVYSLNANSWSFFGSFPISSVTLSHFRVNKAVAFEARPDMKVE